MIYQILEQRSVVLDCHILSTESHIPIKET